jgi:hypothetical protein
MATEPKFRPSLTASQIDRLIQALEVLYIAGNVESMGVKLSVLDYQEITKTKKALELFRFKISEAHTQASYIPTGTAKPKIEVEDLLTESELAAQLGLKGGVDYSSTTAMHTAYRNVRMAQSLGVAPSIPERMAAEKWIEHCDSHNLDYDTGQEK